MKYRMALVNELNKTWLLSRKLSAGHLAERQATASDPTCARTKFLNRRLPKSCQVTRDDENKTRTWFV